MYRYVPGVVNVRGPCWNGALRVGLLGPKLGESTDVTL
jgi:hypothetical protein